MNLFQNYSKFIFRNLSRLHRVNIFLHETLRKFISNEIRSIRLYRQNLKCVEFEGVYAEVAEYLLQTYVYLLKSEDTSFFLRYVSKYISWINVHTYVCVGAKKKSQERTDLRDSVI